MKVSLVSYSDTNGGAARAAYRLHRALLQSQVDSRMCVGTASTGDWTVQTIRPRWLAARNKLHHPMARLLTQWFGSEKGSRQSPNIFASSWQKHVDASDVDVVHLHLMAEEMMSIAEIGRIRKPVVWTLHDMWGFCGAEHVTEDLRWRDGYTRRNRPRNESGFDLNRWTWQRKRRHWRRPMHIVAPSRWLARCVQESVLMREWPVTVIPNPIDVEIWKPIEKDVARMILGIPCDALVVAFGAVGGTRDPNKGFDSLKTALELLRGTLNGLQLIVFGQIPPKEHMTFGIPVRFAGALHDDLSLRVLYSAADVVVVPSRRESLSYCAIEAHACGTPVVAFDTSGIPDVVEHRMTGYLAAPFDPYDLTAGIRWVLDDSCRCKALGRRAREVAVARYSVPVIAEQYVRVYESVLSR